VDIIITSIDSTEKYIISWFDTISSRAGCAGETERNTMKTSTPLDCVFTRDMRGCVARNVFVINQ
jgi:hypothetical protein